MRIQTPYEEKLNTISHAIGVLFGVVGTVLLILKQTNKTDWSLFSVIIYGLTIIVLFTASTCYHAAVKEKTKHYFRIADHISIYLLIAGTYSPICLIALEQSLGWLLFFMVWGIAAAGIVLKLFFTGKFEVFSTLLYLLMGWLVVLDFSNVADFIGENGVLFLILGGLSYTLGIVFYAVNKIPYNHVIWHLFVLSGAVFHFLMVHCYVI